MTRDTILTPVSPISTEASSTSSPNEKSMLTATELMSLKYTDSELGTSRNRRSTFSRLRSQPEGDHQARTGPSDAPLT